MLSSRGIPTGAEHDGEDEDADNEPTLWPLRFFVNGATVSKLDSQVVCPAWMIPPTDLASPILVVKTHVASMAFKGKNLVYDIKYLSMPHTEDEARSTPVLIKVINGRAYAMLMRRHLYLPRLLI